MVFLQEALWPTASYLGNILDIRSTSSILSGQEGIELQPGPAGPPQLPTNHESKHPEVAAVTPNVSDTPGLTHPGQGNNSTGLDKHSPGNM